MTSATASVFAELTGTGVNPLEIHGFQNLLQTRCETFVRQPGVKIEARRPLPQEYGPDNKLITLVTDYKGRLLKESEKSFSKAEIADGIIILRYPNPLKCPGEYYNEWYITESEWVDKYIGFPSTTFTSFDSKKEVTKQGVVITQEVIKMFKGSDGRAEIIPPWGGTMWALERGLLTKEGSAIAPHILEEYFQKSTSPPASSGNPEGILQQKAKLATSSAK